MIDASPGKRVIECEDDAIDFETHYYDEFDEEPCSRATDAISSLDLRSPPGDWAWVGCATDKGSDADTPGFFNVRAAVTGRGVLWMGGVNEYEGDDDSCASFDVTIGSTLLATLPFEVPIMGFAHAVTRH